jgi:hypothetical protein
MVKIFHSTNRVTPVQPTCLGFFLDWRIPRVGVRSRSEDEDTVRFDAACEWHYSLTCTGLLSFLRFRNRSNVFGLSSRKLRMPLQSVSCLAFLTSYIRGVRRPLFCLAVSNSKALVCLRYRDPTVSLPPDCLGFCLIFNNCSFLRLGNQDRRGLVFRGVGKPAVKPKRWNDRIHIVLFVPSVWGFVPI